MGFENISLLNYSDVLNHFTYSLFGGSVLKNKSQNILNLWNLTVLLSTNTNFVCIIKSKKGTRIDE